MKKILILMHILIIAAILFSCAGLPKPREDSDSLIIGSLILDFPDGFFWQGPRTIRNGITLRFTNLNTEKSFSVETTDGYFHLLSKGRDDFLFESFQYFQEEGGEWFKLGKRPIRRKITNSPHKIIYIGHVICTYAKPEATKTEETLNRGKVTLYNYRVSFSGESNKKALLEYLRNKQPDSPWLHYEIEDRFEE